MQNYSATLSGHINGAVVNVTGCGTLDKTTGKVLGNYSVHSFPGNIDYTLLGAILVTGYPHATALNPNLENPFYSGTYSYNRELYFINGPSLQYKGSIISNGSRMCSNFVVNGTAPEFTADRLDKINEEWCADSSSTIEGAFTVRWLDGFSTVAEAYAKSTYETEKPTDGFTLMRTIDLYFFKSNNGFSLTQHSHLQDLNLL